MLKINIIGDFCYPSFAGGSSKHVYDIIHGFKALGYQVTLQTRKKSSNNNYAATSDIKADKEYEQWVKDGTVSEYSIAMILIPLMYLKKIKDADYVILQHPVMGFFGGIMSKILRKKIIYHYHGPIHLEYASKEKNKNKLKYYALWAIQKLTIALADKVLFHSEYMKGVAINEHNIPIRKCFYLPPYIEPKGDIIISERTFNIDSSKINILIPRRLTARTGVVEFLMAFNSIYKQVSPYTIYITGVGELQEEVELLASKNPTNVKYLGFVTYDQLWQLYSEMTCVAVPTIDLEGFGYVILEALSCGAGAIVSKTCGGGYDFVKENLGCEFSFDVKNPDSIKKVLDYIASSPMNRIDCIDISKRYTTDKMMEVYTTQILI